MKLFVNGRKAVFSYLKENISDKDEIIWLHAASLGEFEQGVPVLEALKKEFPAYKILVTFFSPSGYEVKKNNPLADFTTYLPLDTKANAKKFIELVNPKLAIFVKYEVWPNYLKYLKENKSPSLLISGNFRKDQVFFKSQGNFMKNVLKSFDHLFVQNQSSKELLNFHGFKNVSISGDTRFDRVSQQLQLDNKLDFIEDFKNNKICLVCGSTWPEDENLLLEFINTAEDDVKIILAPHQIKEKQIENFRNQLQKESVLFSEKSNHNLKDFPILIIDTVGLLTKIYAYANLAYVGGAAGNTGLHNILEPAAFGVPILIGKNHQKFPEAKLLLNKGGLFAVKTSAECTAVLNKLVNDENYRNKIGTISKEFIQENQGATPKIMDFIKRNFQ